ncbi:MULTISPECIES: NAD(P)-dependent oxidoreductase [Streptomyces]|uniref:NAD(P)-dependent oxidoreductase n=1 Tax=Streptomyces kasugaensis TaxID=1946 RepID=A0A4Q9HMS8_STRKA|nr:NAD(P)-binding domain-containing protein [Streptomyces kasugaensis]TBO56117.1 NAD(P)-dependent oxidoreductase [Streptomyces kasugaensis]WSK13021.1 NAD(P)-binding domain-containing protein [Streptomyces celluloflavus]
MKNDVAVLGLGSMGAALADALLAAGHRVTVWNRTAARADGLVERGARRADSVSEAVAAAELVIVCILDYADVGTLLEQQAGEALAGRVVVNVTNGSPEDGRAMAARVAALGAEYLDGGIMAVPALIGRPEAFVLYSGSTKAFEAHRGTLDSFARSHYLGEDPGLAPLNDLALLSGMYGMFGGFLHAAALVRSAGGSVAEFTTTLLVPWLHAMSGALPAMAAQTDSGEYATTGSNLAMQVSHDALGEVSRDQGVSPELWEPIHSLMTRRVADGHGDEDVASVVELLHRR